MNENNQFAATVAQIGAGDVLEIASEQLHEIVRAVEDTGKAGTLTLTIEVKPRGRDSGQVELTAKVGAKAPIHDIPSAIFFVAEGGELLRDNPRQKKFAFADEPERVTKKAASE